MPNYGLLIVYPVLYPSLALSYFISGEDCCEVLALDDLDLQVVDLSRAVRAPTLRV